MKLRDRRHPSPARGRRIARRLALFALLVAVLPVAAIGRTRVPARSSVRPVASEATAGLATVAGRTAAPASGGLIRETSRGGASLSAYPDAGSILLSNGLAFDPVVSGEPALPPSLTTTSMPSGTASYLVQLSGPVLAGQREQIAAAGAAIFSYVPRYTYLVRMTESTRSSVASLPFVRWVGVYQPAYKMSDRPEMAAVSGSQTLALLLFPDAGLAATLASLESMGATILEATDSGRNKIIRARVDMSIASSIAAMNDVAWVEPWVDRTLQNNVCQWVVQTNVSNNRRVWDMGLHGEGQVVHTSDSGIRTTHFAFRDPSVPITTWGQYPTHRKIIAYIAGGAGRLFGDDAGASYHGTHTAGTIVGDDSPFAGDPRDGNALKAKIYFTDVGDASTSVFPPADLNLLFQPPYDGNAGGAARVTSNSWGSPVPQYDIQAMTVDQFMWDHRDFVALFSNGNQAGPATTGSPAVNKDGLGVGATQNGANAGIKASFSSEGPTLDGRRKPTVMAPGDGATPLSGIFSANGANDTGYKGLSGTSMACPAAAGATLLVRQYCTDGWYPTGAPVAANGFTPSGALLKAMVMTSTDNDMTGQNIPNTTVGWGRIKLDNILFFPGDAARTALVDQQDGLATGEFTQYQITVNDVSVPLKITLCWTDKEGNPNAATQLVNDLDLTVTDPNGTIYRGNVFAAGQSVSGGTSDMLNVEESVRLNTPVLGTWTVRVQGANIPFGPQPFAIAVSGGVGNTVGTLQLDRQTYNRSDAIHVRVEDVNAIAPVTVNLASTTEATPEVVTLAGGNGVFTATVPTTALLAANGDGMLSVSNGDAITATYVDPNPAGTVTASALAAFDGPTVSGVGVFDTGSSTRITWTTDVLATSRVYFGPTAGLGQTTALDPTLTSSHTVTLTGLQPQTEYYFDVESSDHAGNTTRDDNGGAHYRFASGTRGDVLVVIGDGTFGRDSIYANALATSGWSASFLSGGVIANPLLGDRTVGLRSRAAVWWQVGLEQYPPLEDAARDSLTAYLAGGGRLAVTGHDIAWAFTDPASGHQTPARTDWLHNTLHATFLEDPAGGWAVNQGIAGDPVSDAYQAGVAYAPHRQGASGDEIASLPGSGTAAYDWLNTDATADHIGIRWEDGAPNGSPAGAVWGGTPSRLLYNAFEWSGIVNPGDRAAILDRSLIWLVGRDHPDVTITSPNSGIIPPGTATIAWTEAAYGASIASRSLYYSSDGGASWHLIATGVGPSPYAWNLTGLHTGLQYRVRVVVTDDGAVPLTGRDDSDGDCTIAEASDQEGPVVEAGSIRANPNPLDNRAVATLTARISDVGHGFSNIAAAEWSWGVSPSPAGSGHPMSGDFSSPQQDVSVTVPSGAVNRGEQQLWVRGQDAGGTWGPATAQTFMVNGNVVVGVENAGMPTAFALEHGAPNPAQGGITTIRFALPVATHVDLAVYGLRGERIRTLVSGQQAPGYRSVRWDGRDDAGRAVRSGVFFYRLAAGGFRSTQKLIVLR